MRRGALSTLALLLCLSPGVPRAAQKDAAGCKDDPLAPRVPSYYIELCTPEAHNTADVEVEKDGASETLHLDGPSRALSYRQGPGAKVTEEELRRSFDEGVKRQGAVLVGVTVGQRWPVYRIVKGGKTFLVFLMVSSGEYFNGSYACRIAEQGTKT